MYKFACRLGITGLAQVSDSRRLRTPVSYALEIWAARHRTAPMTLRIFVLTPLFILGWRKVGQRRLDRVLGNTELLEIEQACEQELSAVLS